MHPDDAHGLQVQLATALKERDEARLALANAITARDEETNESDARADAAESERDALRTALTEVNNLLMSVPQHEDWRAIVRKKVVVALFGEAAWETK